ncbi:hypothetical protein C0989_000682 [Termitomyces sp. Mn162]|nr:hypothetical protein C0989_000682 [Termitomyces sp. Mn162]KAH0588660.1 hypothetical protein H2248_004474 [Termitomyces sp. 'cryptogamus']
MQMKGKVYSGFGRGPRELGIPNVNLPVDDKVTPSYQVRGASLCRLPSHPPNGIIRHRHHDAPEAHSRFSLYPMVMSIGNNKFYKKTVRSAEAHLLHEFGADFYGVEMRLLNAGFIREQKDYAELEELIEEIKVDCDVAHESLDCEAWALRKTGKGTLDGSGLVRGTVEQNRNRGVGSGRHSA